MVILCRFLVNFVFRCSNEFIGNCMQVVCATNHVLDMVTVSSNLYSMVVLQLIVARSN